MTWLLLRAAESVTVAPDGALIMCDKFGYVWRAAPTKRGGFDLMPKPVAHLGAGRPLGFQFDADRKLVVCMAGAVRLPHSSPCCLQQARV